MQFNQENRRFENVNDDAVSEGRVKYLDWAS